MKFEKTNLINPKTEENRIEDIQLAAEALKDKTGRSFSKIYNKYYDKVYAKCLSIVGEKYAEDTTQEIFTKVFLNLNRFNGTSSLGTWIFPIATNYCIDILKKQKNDLLAQAQGPVILENLEDDFDKVVFAEGKEQERFEFVRKCLEVLPSKDADLLKKAYIEDKRIVEIAEDLGESVPAIKMRLMRLKQRLHKEFMQAQKLSDN